MATKNEEIKWFHRPIVVLVLLFFVLGPLALPLLYKSPAFSKSAKVILTTVVILISAYIVLLTINIVKDAISSMDALQKML
ncbi:MAG: hypothetical protein ABH823_00940 [bacterium]